MAKTGTGKTTPKAKAAAKAKAAKVKAPKAKAPKAGKAKPAKKIVKKLLKAGAVGQSALLPLEAVSGASVLDRLWGVIESRRSADPGTSHSARLLSRGTGKVAQKFGEEAVECVIEAVSGRRAALIAESADVLYHLLVIWVDAGILPGEVWAELVRREGVSGIAEKAARPKALNPTRTRKIP